MHVMLEQEKLLSSPGSLIQLFPYGMIMTKVLGEKETRRIKTQGNFENLKYEVAFSWDNGSLLSCQLSLGVSSIAISMLS